MTDFGQELGSLDFENIIGGPLTAVVEAQAHAAETSIEFINEVGLTFEDGRITPIKTVFSYQKESTDEQGVTRSRTHNIEVPVLAIVPIPYMVFNDVWLNFNVNLNSVENRSRNSFTGGSIAGRGRFGGFSFSGSVAASRQKRDTGTVSKTYAMGVKIHAVQDEMPEGMERVLNILEQVAKAEVKPYNAVKQISTTSPSGTPFAPGIEYGGDGHIMSWDFDGGAGYGSTETIDFVPDVTESSAWLQWQDVPHFASTGSTTDSIKTMQRWLNAVGSKDSPETPTEINGRPNSKYILSSNGDLLDDDGMIGRKTMQSLIRYAETYYNDGANVFELPGSTDANVKAAVDAIHAHLCGGDYDDRGNNGISTGTAWTTSAHTHVSHDTHGDSVSHFITSGSTFSSTAETGMWDILTQLRLDFIETLGRRAPTIRLTIPSGGSASSFSMAITDPGNCLVGADETGSVATSPIEGATLTDPQNTSIVLKVDFDVGANGKLEFITWDDPTTNPTPEMGSVTHASIPLFASSGIGVGATASITISGDSISSVNIDNAGLGYEVGDVLTVDNFLLGTNGNGFSVTVTEVEQTETSIEAVYLATATGGTGTGLEVRVTVDHTGASKFEIVDGGRDYTVDDAVTLSAPGETGNPVVIVKQVG